VRQQILDRDLALRRHSVELRRRWLTTRVRRGRTARAAAGRRWLRDGHLHVAELRDVARHRVVQPQLPFLDHHHHADADHGLGHRRDAEHVRGRHRLLRLEVHDALRVDVGDLAFARDGDDGAGQIARGDAALNHLRDALESLG
jgi:hypothetical protein